MPLGVAGRIGYDRLLHGMRVTRATCGYCPPKGWVSPTWKRVQYKHDAQASVSVTAPLTRRRVGLVSVRAGLPRSRVGLVSVRDGLPRLRVGLVSVRDGLPRLRVGLVLQILWAAA